ncbi:MAG: NADP-dependent malic enzyme [Acholeplasmataceae bacterium]
MDKSLKLHYDLKGKIEIKSKYDINNKLDLSLVYTPGVASSCLKIQAEPDEAYKLTSKHNTVAVISDGSAVLGLGNIGPLAAIPVMEGKCALFKRFAGVDAIPIVLDTQDTEEIIKTITYLAPSFGGINLEDISAPRCFEIERRLRELLHIPVFHDDQHGTAIAVGSALLNALRFLGKKIEKVKIIVNGAGSAGVAISTFLMKLGAKNIVVCDRFGIISTDDERLNETQRNLAKISNPNKEKGLLIDAFLDADVFIGVSAGHIVNQDMIHKMNKDAIVFALANPMPEIEREDALNAGVRIYGSGVSNQPNQINNAIVFPGLFKGALESKIEQITEDIEIAVCYALSNIIPQNELNEEYIIPDIFNEDISKTIIRAVYKVSHKQ